MKYCANCGAANTDDALFCTACGTKVEVAAAPAQEAAPAPQAAPVEEVVPAPAPVPVAQPAPQQTYQQPQQVYQQPQQAYQQPAQPNHSVKATIFGIIGFVCAIVSIVFSWMGCLPAAGIFLGILMIIHAVVGLIFSGISTKAGGHKLAKPAKIIAIIGLVLCIIFFIIGIIVTASIGNISYYY